MLDMVLGKTTAARASRAIADRAAAVLSRCCASLNDMLDLSKIEAGKMTLREERLSTSRQRGPECMKAEQPKAGARIDPSCGLEVAPEVPAQVMGDPLRIRQILSSLISNAVKFTQRGTVGVHIDGQISGRGEFLLQSRCRTAEPEFQPTRLIFDKFTQADAA